MKPYAFSGIVVLGKQLGRTIGFPTANILPDSDHSIPLKFGVYAVEVRVKNRLYPAMANLGMNPTLDEHHVTLEAHIFDFSEDIYGEVMTVFFYQYVREEMKFPGLDELKEQIKKDEIRIRKILSDRV